MVSKFTLKNQTTSKEFIFGQDFDCDYIFKSGDIDWGSVGATHNTYNYPGQVGVSISNTKLNTRDISVTGFVFYSPNMEDVAGMSVSERDEYCYSMIKSKKRDLNEVINPNDYITLTIGTYFIEGKPNSSVIYGRSESDNNIYFCSFNFTLYCANPMFKKITKITTNVKESTGMFMFPLTIPEEEGIPMSSRDNYLVINVENEGDVDIGGRIMITANGEIVNPIIENLETGEVIRINKTMTEGEVIIVNTNDGSERGITGFTTDGRVHNYLKYWDFTNTWFKFKIGSSLLGYSCENQNELQMSVIVEINPQKFNLEEM